MNRFSSGKHFHVIHYYIKLIFVNNFSIIYFDLSFKFISMHNLKTFTYLLHFHIIYSNFLTIVRIFFYLNGWVLDNLGFYGNSSCSLKMVSTNHHNSYFSFILAMLNSTYYTFSKIVL